MKNYKVQAIMKFTDKEENGIKRNVGDEFETTKERYEYLKFKNAVKLIEIQETIDNFVEEKTTEEEVVNEIIEESKEEAKPKFKKKKTSKK